MVLQSTFLYIEIRQLHLQLSPLQPLMLTSTKPKYKKPYEMTDDERKLQQDLMK